MGGSNITNKAKPNKWKFGSGVGTHLSNNVNSNITQSPQCTNRYIPSDTPTVDSQSTNKMPQMDSKSPTFPVYRCPRYHRTASSYSDTIYTWSTTHAYTKEITGIETGMVRVKLPFNNFTATPNGIRVKYPDEKISQATHSDILKIPFLPVEERRVHLFDTLASGSLISLGKLYNAGCTYYFNSKKVYIFFQGENFLRGVRSASSTFLWKIN